MRTISQRELRNDNAEIMRGVERGERYLITRRGVPIATLASAQDDTGLRCVKPARAPLNPAALRRVVSLTPTADVVADLRGDR